MTTSPQQRRPLVAIIRISLLVLIVTGFQQQTDAQDTAQATQLRVETAPDQAGWNVYRGQQLVAGYMKDSNSKPVIYPLFGPGGHPMTRDFPMKEAGEYEKDDHDHHRSMWLTHGDVNGFDFWLDDDHCGKIVQTSGQAKQFDGSVVISTTNDWIDPEGNKILADSRRFEFRDLGDRRIIDCDFKLNAKYGDVNFGDTKEGSFGVRVAGTMKVDAKKGGLITNAEGLHNKGAWGKKSAWVNYSGPVNGDSVGMAIHDHPSSFGYPCRWHVRTYGLFAANPFGVHHFVGGEKTKGIELPEGESMQLHYRVVLYQGDFDADVAKNDSKSFADSTRPNVE